MSDTGRFRRKTQPQEYDVFIRMNVDKRSIVLRQVDHPGVKKSGRMLP